MRFSTRHLPVVFLLFLTLALGACASGPQVVNPASVAEVETQAQRTAGEIYRIIAGNELDIKFYYTPELNERVTVRPDGRISLQLIDDVVAAGKTPDELAAHLEQRYAGELKTPEIAVIVNEANQKVYIDGEVDRPGVLDLDGPVTVLQAVAYAGGFTDKARRDSIILIRRQSAQNPLVIPLNIEQVYSGTDLGQDLLLAHFDIVHVPKSPIANVNLFIDQYIRQNIPSPFLPFLATD